MAFPSIVCSFSDHSCRCPSKGSSQKISHPDSFLAPTQTFIKSCPFCPQNTLILPFCLTPSFLIGQLQQPLMGNLTLFSPKASDSFKISVPCSKPSDSWTLYLKPKSKLILLACNGPQDLSPFCCSQLARSLPPCHLLSSIHPARILHAPPWLRGFTCALPLPERLFAPYLTPLLPFQSSP